MSYADIAATLNVSRADLTTWDNPKENKALDEYKKRIATIKKLHTTKEIKCDFEEFYNWFQTKEKDKKCLYCGITEPELEKLFNIESEKGLLLTKRKRGKKLELDRKVPDAKYTDLNNIVYACYWCNNAKTDTFTEEEFLKVGEIIGQIWKKRLGK